MTQETTKSKQKRNLSSLLDVTDHMTEYLFRQSCAPWLANLANRLFDHTRAITNR